jgi:hypothetical protein
MNERVFIVKEAHVASPAPRPFGTKGNINAPKAHQMALKWKASLMKASNISGAACAVHSCVQTMPYPRRYFIVLYCSMFVTLLPQKYFS